ncbi:MAG: NapC/NirT family cytochrome c [Xanthomonadales bacterium]|nr:NapC/NirT family cytochrome c [Xanthomonadales bacterium]
MSKPSIIRRLISAFRRPSVRWGAGTLVVSGVVAGALLWAGFITVVDATGSEEFCTSCHEMNAFVYQEYKASVHYISRSGVRPKCDSCHVPHEFFPKIARKIRATLVEVPSHLMGTIDTREKFEAKREELARNVWAEMEANDSEPCRGCHETDHMALEEQELRARREHEEGFARGDTCIDCHKGIAHKLPDAFLEEQAEEVEFDF